MNKRPLAIADLANWDHLRWNAFKSEKHKLIYISTPKVACTSIKWWFAELEGVTRQILDGQESNESDPDLVIHDTFHKISPDTTGLLPENLVEALSSSGYFKFALVRNPYKRIFSAWQSKILLREPLQIYPYKKFDFLYLPVADMADIRFAFERFVEHLATYEAPNFLDPHWTPQFDLLRPDVISYSNVAKIEDLALIKKEIEQHLSKGVPSPFALRSTNESLIPYSSELISDRAAELIRNLYHRDFEFFGYSTCLPENKKSLSSEELQIALKAIHLIQGRHQRMDEIRCVLQGELFSSTAENQELQLTIKKLVEANAYLEQGVKDARQEISQIMASTSWKITKPFRVARRMVNIRGFQHGSQLLQRWAQIAWHSIPLTNERKLVLKSILFTRLPAVFGRTEAYRSWYAMNFPGSPLPSRRGFRNALGQSMSSESADSYVPLLRATEPKNLPVRLIAFYLPQFHAIKENNEWWGEGFTEWTNVRPARPQFEGHYQPHVPGELGYYNLLDRDVQRRQIELAKLYGVGGFCFYYYWFGGKRLLEQPIENYLADSELDHPFCLCWANENWSRRWDGKDSEVLIAQHHSPEDDLAFAADVARYMLDSRYIRIDGKPLLLVYRPSLLPSALETSQRWREWFREAGLGEVYLAYTQSFESEDPKKYGFDAAIEFPPNNSAPPNITSEVLPLDDAFAGTVYDWSALAKRSRSYKKMPYKLFRSVCPSWDNTARRKSRGTIFHGSSPKAYQEWLENAVAETCRNSNSPDERLVFVNAWNEWAEGAHLEPDQQYGYAWLDATRKALTGEPAGPYKESIAVVSHDAHPHGAQFLALGIVRSLTQDLKLDVHTVLLGEGRLKADFAQFSEVHEAYLGADFEVRAEKLARELEERGVHRAIVNTTVSGAIVKAFSKAGIRCVCLVHEMPGVIQSRNLQEPARSIAQYAHKVVFPAAIVEEGFAKFAEVKKSKTAIRPQGLWRRNLLRFRKAEIRTQIREKLGIEHDAPLILAVGYADHRKGVDLFAQSALEILRHKPDALFVWIGHWDEDKRREVDALIAGYEESFRFLGYEPNTAAYHAAADVYALTSREDPFPNVVLESFDAGVPVVAFAGTGGGAQLVSEVGGRVVPANDCVAFAGAILELLQNPEGANALADEACHLVDRDYSFRSYLFDLCNHLDLVLPRISVVVPNYNYADYIQARLESIFKQTRPLFELIILDDASSDNSIERITQWLAENSVECRLVVNERNSGSVFDQWAKGVSLATGDYIWIAEADDLSRPYFLETVISPMEQRPDVCLSYCESQQIDQHGRRLSIDYHAYREDICAGHWRAPFISDGKDEIINYLAVKNTIPNVSSVLFRREPIAKVFAEHLPEIRKLRRAGDWLAYVKVLENGAIAFSPRPDNLHRRHSVSVIARDRSQLIEEISYVQRSIARDFELPSAIMDLTEKYLQHLRRTIEKANTKVGSV